MIFLLKKLLPSLLFFCFTYLLLVKSIDNNECSLYRIFNISPAQTQINNHGKKLIKQTTKMIKPNKKAMLTEVSYFIMKISNRYKFFRLYMIHLIKSFNQIL